MEDQAQAAADILKGQNITAPISTASFDGTLTSTATDSGNAPSQFFVIQRQPMTSAGQ